MKSSRISKLVVILTILLVLVIGSVLTVLQWPGLVVNAGNLRRLAAWSGRMGTQVSWEDEEIVVTSTGLFQHSFDFRFNRLCLQREQEAFKLCVESLEFSLEAGWEDLRRIIPRLGPLTVKGGELTLVLPSRPEQKIDEEDDLTFQLPRLVLPAFLRATRIGAIRIEIDKLRVSKGVEELSGDFVLSGDPDSAGRLSRMQADVSLSDGEAGGVSVKTSLVIENETGFLKPSAAWKLNGSFSYGGWSGNLEGGGDLAEKGIDGVFSGNLLFRDKLLQKAVMTSCTLALKDRPGEPLPGQILVNCPVQVDFGRSPFLRMPKKFHGITELPSTVKVTVQADLMTSNPPSWEGPVSGTVTIILDAIARGVLTLGGKAVVHLSGIPSKYPEGWDLQTDLGLNIKIPSFQRLGNVMKKNGFEIPPPFETLRGPLEIDLNGRSDLARLTGRIPVHFETNLSSEAQAFETEGKGVVTYRTVGGRPQVDLEMDLDLKDVKLSLPSLGLGAFPSLFPDKRLGRWNEKIVAKKREGTFNYHLKVRTPPDHPVRLLTGVAQGGGIPIYVDLDLSRDAYAGTLEIRGTSLNIFRRKADIPSFKLFLKTPLERSQVDGEVRVDNADYKIKIRVVGSVDRPQVILESDPPLSREEIVSFLIYGETFEDLDSEKAQSVAQTSAAVSNRALALGTLFFLASTPIQSISYDPERGVFTAKLRLTKSTSLTVGSRAGSFQGVGAKRRLKGNWYIRTYFENSEETGRQKEGAFLEWFKRY